MLEFPRSLFDEASITIHSAKGLRCVFEALDELVRVQIPFLGLELVAVSDKVIRYGLRQESIKSRSGMALDRVRSYQDKGKSGLELRFSAMCDIISSTVCQLRKANGHFSSLLQLYFSITSRIYRACQEAYCRKTLPKSDYSSDSSSRLDLPCLLSKFTPNGARALYLRLVVSNALLITAELALRTIFSVEIISPVGEPFSFCSFRNPAFKTTVMLPRGINIGSHAFKHGNRVFGVFRLVADREHESVYQDRDIMASGSTYTDEVIPEQTAVLEDSHHLSTAEPHSLTANPSLPSETSASANDDCLLRDCEIEPEFVETAERAIAETGGPQRDVFPPVLTNQEWLAVTERAGILNSDKSWKLIE